MRRVALHDGVGAVIGMRPLREVRVDGLHAPARNGREEPTAHLGAVALVICETSQVSHCLALIPIQVENKKH
jgi:hypothetical protein